eukprot:m.41220 g.41220  ORF g.41220 m.41220 type:complete len:95 (-) comp10407_c1_seq3:2727-3011(-)
MIKTVLKQNNSFFSFIVQNNILYYGLNGLCFLGIPGCFALSLTNAKGDPPRTSSAITQLCFSNTKNSINFVELHLYTGRSSSNIPTTCSYFPLI